MSSLISAAYTAASVVSARQASLGSLITAAGQDPTPGSITASSQAQVESAAAVLVFKKAIAAAQQEGANQASLYDQQSGIGQNLDAYA